MLSGSRLYARRRRGIQIGAGYLLYQKIVFPGEVEHLVRWFLSLSIFAIISCLLLSKGEWTEVNQRQTVVSGNSTCEQEFSSQIGNRDLALRPEEVMMLE